MLLLNFSFLHSALHRSLLLPLGAHAPVPCHPPSPRVREGGPPPHHDEDARAGEQHLPHRDLRLVGSRLRVRVWGVLLNAVFVHL
jgi:hypothetical protein